MPHVSTTIHHRSRVVRPRLFSSALICGPGKSGSLPVARLSARASPKPCFRAAGSTVPAVSCVASSPLLRRCPLALDPSVPASHAVHRSQNRNSRPRSTGSCGLAGSPPSAVLQHPDLRSRQAWQLAGSPPIHNTGLPQHPASRDAQRDAVCTPPGVHIECVHAVVKDN